MTKTFLMAAGALLASTSAFAQGTAPAEQSSADLICQLADSCAADAAEEVVEEEEVEVSPAPAVPGARVSATRGFKIASKVNTSTAAKATSPAKAPAAAATRPKARVTAVQAKRPTAPGKGVKAAAAVKAGSGRADLRVSFVTGSAELTEYGQREAQKFVEALRSPLLAGMRFRIEGHTDAVGNRDYNLDLSKRRAQAVVDYLAGKGIDRGRFDVAGYGFDKPLPGTSAGAAANRRVEVVRIK